MTQYQNAYATTSVHWTRSQTAIIQFLQKRGITESRFTSLADRFVLEFRVVENGIAKPVAIRIVVPFQRYDSQARQDKETNRLYRVLFYHLKAKFVAIDSGLTEFLEEFMSHLIVTDKSGNSATMGHMLLPQYKNSLESGDQQEFKLLPGN
jgi:hypothetical protein